MKEYKNQITVLLAVLVLCFGIVFSTVLISRTQFYIQNLGNSLQQDGKLVNTITVAGDGKVFATPDMVTFYVSVSEVASTSAEALQNANTKTDDVMKVLTANGISGSDIKTSQLSIAPEYRYSGNDYQITGQRATVSLNVKVKGIDAKATKAAKIIDEVSKVSNIQINSISFDIEKKEELLSQARAQAYDAAKAKADELAKKAGVNLLKPVSISDTVVNTSTPQPLYSAALDSAGADKSSTQISGGQLEISVSVSVLFGID